MARICAPIKSDTQREQKEQKIDTYVRVLLKKVVAL